MTTFKYFQDLTTNEISIFFFKDYIRFTKLQEYWQVHVTLLVDARYHLTPSNGYDIRTVVKTKRMRTFQKVVSVFIFFKKCWWKLNTDFLFIWKQCIYSLCNVVASFIETFVVSWNYQVRLRLSRKYLSPNQPANAVRHLLLLKCTTYRLANLVIDIFCYASQGGSLSL